MSATSKLLTLVWSSASLLGAAACGPERKPELIEHRVESCTAYCEVQLDPVCGKGPWGFEDVQDCVEDCALPGGGYAWDWGPQRDGSDACASEWLAYEHCVTSLSCEQQQLYFAIGPDTPPEERLCWDEVMARNNCAAAAEADDR